MKSITLQYVRKRIQSTHPRTRKALFNTISGIAIKGGSMVISLLLVPLTIDYLTKENYGTWLTISSVVTMLSFLDIGIGNGLRNKFSEAVAQQDKVLARAYVSTAYLTFGCLQLIFIFFFLLLCNYIPWQHVFNTNIDIQQLQIVVMLTMVAISIKLVLDILSYILFALQESSWVSVINLLSNILILIGIYVLRSFFENSLIYLATVTVVSPIIIALASSFVLYKNKLKIYRPSFQFAQLKYAKSLLTLGYKFFFIQIAGLVLFYTDNLIITQLFGPSEVTTYNIAFRYFNAISTLFTIAITPYWSAFTEASVKGDNDWMKRTYQFMQKLWLGFVVVIALMVIVSDLVYAIWIGDRVIVPFDLSICMGLFIIVSCWNSSIAAVINGLGKIRLQLYLALFSSFINIPLAIWLGQTLKLGSTGIILATIISLLVCSIFCGLQAKRLIAGNAKGIWNQ